MNVTVHTRCCHKLDSIMKPILSGIPSTFDQNGTPYIIHIVFNGFYIIDGGTQSFGI